MKNVLSKKIFLSALAYSIVSCGYVFANNKNTVWSLSSPDKNVVLTVKNGNKLTYDVRFGNKTAIEESELGLILDNMNIASGVTLTKESKAKEINEKYSLKAGKKLNTQNHCMEKTLSFKNTNGQSFDIEMRVYNDGAAFRYVMPENDNKKHCINEELTEFAVPTNGKAWIHPYIVDSRGRCCYEEWAEKEIAIRSAAPKESGWYFPMLFNTNNLWMLITEAEIDGNYPATHTDNSGKDNAYKIRFPEKNETVYADAPVATSTMPWKTPWRCIIVGDGLEDIFATQMVTHLNPPTEMKDLSWIKPGRSSWSWWSEKKAKSYKRQVEYVNLSKELDWEYVLLDAGWPIMKDGGNMEDVVKYAKAQGVDTWIWYSSYSGNENNPDHKYIMCNKDTRRKEMERISKIGVKGVKIDFFDTDKQNAMKLYIDILNDAAEYKLMVDLHGCTLPRGWERTYPHLMTMEAVKGGEGMGQQLRCDNAPSHHTVLTYTRNVVGSMDYTPLIFSIKNPKAEKPGIPRTTYSHQLALSVVFESGFQCFADNEKTYRALPDKVKSFLKVVPCTWDDSRLLAGYPGDHSVVLREKDGIWYLGGISGKDKNRKLTFNIPEECIGKTLYLTTDGKDNKSFDYKQIKLNDKKISINLLPFGGFSGIIK